jgi:hypothetical protein
MSWFNLFCRKWKKVQTKKDDCDDGKSHSLLGKLFHKDRDDDCNTCREDPVKYEKFSKKADWFQAKADKFADKGWHWLSKKYEKKANWWQEKAEKYKCEEPNTPPEADVPAVVLASTDSLGELARFTASDADNDSLIFTLSGEEIGGVSDADLFEVVKISDTEVALNIAGGVPLPLTGSVDGDLDFELTLTVDDQNGGVSTFDFDVILAQGA